MGGGGKRWLRGVVTLGVLSALATGLVVSPVGAGSKFATKKFVKKQIAKLGNEIAATEGVYSAFKQGPVDINSVGVFPLLPDAPSLAAIASLSVPPGKYAIDAKLLLAGSSNEKHCRLAAGGDTDDVREYASFEVAPSLQMVHDFTEAGLITLSCADNATAGNTSDKAYFIKITAIRARSLTNTPSP
jgi:hypothetical protein